MLICAGCVFMAIYESLEYSFCYDEEKKEHIKQMKQYARAQLASETYGQSPSTSLAGDASESTRLLDAEEIPLDPIISTPSDITQDLQCDSSCEDAYSGRPDRHPDVEENVLFDQSDMFGDVFVDVDMGETGFIAPATGQRTRNTQVTLNTTTDMQSTNYTFESSRKQSDSADRRKLPRSTNNSSQLGMFQSFPSMNANDEHNQFGLTDPGERQLDSLVILPDVIE